MHNEQRTMNNEQTLSLPLFHYISILSLRIVAKKHYKFSKSKKSLQAEKRYQQNQMQLNKIV